MANGESLHRDGLGRFLTAQFLSAGELLIHSDLLLSECASIRGNTGERLRRILKIPDELKRVFQTRGCIVPSHLRRGRRRFRFLEFGAGFGLSGLSENAIRGRREMLGYLRIQFGLHCRSSARILQTPEQIGLLSVGVIKRVIATVSLPDPEVRPLSRGGLACDTGFDTENTSQFTFRRIARKRCRSR